MLPSCHGMNTLSCPSGHMTEKTLARRDDDDVGRAMAVALLVRLRGEDGHVRREFGAGVLHEYRRAACAATLERNEPVPGAHVRKEVAHPVLAHRAAPGWIVVHHERIGVELVGGGQLLHRLERSVEEDACVLRGGHRDGHIVVVQQPRGAGRRTCSRTPPSSCRGCETSHGRSHSNECFSPPSFQMVVTPRPLRT